MLFYLVRFTYTIDPKGQCAVIGAKGHCAVIGAKGHCAVIGARRRLQVM